MVFSNEVLDLVAEAEIALRDTFDEIDRVSFSNTKRVMNAFSEHRVSDDMFGSTSGYGYDDKGGTYSKRFGLTSLDVKPRLSDTL